jgi:histidine decarboxylase
VRVEGFVMKQLQELEKLHKQFEAAAKEMLGYPLCQLFNYSKIVRFLKFHINNLGDPFGDIWHYRINTLKQEKQVIDYLAKLFHAPKNGYWGYVTTGGTEGNLYGLYVARELHPDGVVLYSDQTHYSVPKNIHLLKLPEIQIPSTENGEIDYRILKKKLASLGKTPIIFANIGTTMRGAVDNILKIKEILAELRIKKYYIHCDAAFFGLILPFLPKVESQAFDFRTGVDSIVISGHKMIGTPVPCGVVITKKEHITEIGTHIEYVGTKDSTIAGSRNGLSPLFLWHEFFCVKKGSLAKRVQKCIESADYAIKKFSEFGIKAWRNPNSMIVVFPKPSVPLIKKWQLAIQKDIAHIITLAHVRRKMIDRLVKQIAFDLSHKSTRAKNRAFLRDTR